MKHGRARLTKMSQVYSIEIPYLPQRELSPNWRGHWAEKYKAAQQLKQDAYVAAKFSLIPVFKKATITFKFIVPDRRRRDPDNFLASMKPAVDGLVAAGIFPDDSSEVVSFAPVVFKLSRRGKPKTIIEIRGETG